MGGGSGKDLQRRATTWTPWRERAQVGGGEGARQQELCGGRPEHVRSSLPEIWKSEGQIVEPGSVPQ